LQEKLNVISLDVLKAGSALSGGVTRHGETCGALLGGIMAVGALIGRERLSDKAQSQKAMVSATRVYDAFKEKIGHTLCSEIHKIRHGKTYRLYIPEERTAFHDAGGHGPQGCPVVCGTAARIAAEVILDLKEEK
jgi:C_GCAxxG_C_C family probable redox protein